MLAAQKIGARPELVQPKIHGNAAVVEPIGAVYVALLEMVVFPFIVSSLLHGLGSLRRATALRLLRSGWPFFVLGWGVTLVAMWLLAQAIPEAAGPSWSPRIRA